MTFLRPVKFTNLFAAFLRTGNREPQGVLRQYWSEPVNYEHSAVLRDNPYFLSQPTITDVIPDFDAPLNFAEEYGQQLLAYFQVSPHTLTALLRILGKYQDF